MKSSYQFYVSAMVMTFIMLTGQADAQLIGLWEFNNSAAPGAATIGNDLIVNNTNSTIASVTGISGGDGAFSVGIGDYFTCNHDIPANGGGAYVNEFTIVYDLYLPLSTDAVYRSLLQTSADNSNDGDYWLSTTNRVGVAAIGYSTDTVSAGAWYRIVFSADIGNTPSFRTTVTDAAGASWSFDHLDQGVDGRHSLYPIDNQNIVHFFADEDSEDNEVHVSNLALFDTPLSQADAERLGTPGTPIPEPSTLAMIVLVGLGLLAFGCRSFE